MPYEARQPSMKIEMVPIHSKRSALKDERKDSPIYDYAFLLIAGRHFLFVMVKDGEGLSGKNH